MGMFDYITCHHPALPAELRGVEHQTKDTPRQWMVHYCIDASGSLWEIWDDGAWHRETAFTGVICIDDWAAHYHDGTLVHFAKFK